MTQKDAIKLFEDRQVRSVWDSEAKKWYISIIDVIEVLTDSANPRRYWSDLNASYRPREVSCTKISYNSK